MQNEITRSTHPDENILYSSLSILHDAITQPEPDDRAFLVGCLSSLDRMLEMVGGKEVMQ